jgi:hypothetical protein
MIKKIVISPTNTRTIAFLEELSKKKEAIKRRLEIRSLDKVKRDADNRTGK